MNDKAITICEADFPGIWVNDKLYDLLCQYDSKDNIPTSVYVSWTTSNAIITQNDTAISGVFSIEDAKLFSLLDYIEATMSRKTLLDTYCREDMELFLTMAQTHDRNYPLLELSTQNEKPSLMQKALLYLKPQKKLDPSLIQMLKEHTVPIRYQEQKELDISEDCFLTPKYSEKTSLSEKTFPEKLSLDENSIQGILGQLAENAWYGRNPTSVSFCAGDHTIRMDGYTYEPSYESFDATASISFNGEVLYGVDSRNVDAYRNERYQTGKFDTLEQAIQHIKEQTNGLDFILQEHKEKKGLDAQISSAASELFRNSANENNHHTPSKDPAIEL